MLVSFSTFVPTDWSFSTLNSWSVPSARQFTLSYSLSLVVLLFSLVSRYLLKSMAGFAQEVALHSIMVLGHSRRSQVNPITLRAAMFLYTFLIFFIDLWVLFYEYKRVRVTSSRWWQIVEIVLFSLLLHSRIAPTSSCSSLSCAPDYSSLSIRTLSIQNWSIA